MTGTEELKKLWTEKRCLDLISQQKVIELDSNVPIGEACEVLVSNGISSAPVFNAQSKSYVGMIDYRDIVDYVLARDFF